MSRTYRRSEEIGRNALGRFWTWKEEKEIFGDDCVFISIGWACSIRINPRGRDKKPWYKPDKSFKRMKRQAEKAKIKDSIAKGKEIPFFRKSDQYDWT